jgi:hypothetical protein
VVRRGPLGSAQQFEWWQSQNPGPCGRSNIAVTVGLRRPAEPGRVVAALDLLVERHEALRTTIEFGTDGVPTQIVQPPAATVYESCPFVDDDTFRSFREKFRLREFRAESTPLRVVFVLSDHLVRTVLVVVSHSVCDAAAATLLRRELEETIEAHQQRRVLTRPPAVQPIDVASAEQADHLAEARARDYWEREFRQMPSRMFMPPGRHPTVLLSGVRTSSATAAALVLSARRARTSAPIVYGAVIHALLAAIAPMRTTVVRHHFSARMGEEMRTAVGCFQRAVFTVVDLSDDPPLGTIIARTQARMLRGRSRQQIGDLALRELLAEAAFRRGIAFAEGVTVNFTPSPELDALQELDAATLHRLVEGADQHTSRLEPEMLARDEQGIDASLRVSVERRGLRVDALFNSASLRDAQMRVLLGGPHRVLTRYLDAGELSFEEIAGCVGATEPVAADGVITRDGIGRVDEITALLRRHPAVNDAFVGVDEEHGLTAFVATDAGDLTPAGIRQFVLAQLHPAAPVVCPEYIVVCAGAPTAGGGQAEWRVAPRMSEGTGRRTAPRSPVGVAESLLHELVCVTNTLPEVDMAQPYVSARGRLLMVPHLIRRLADAGYTGLVPDDFTRPRSLSQLAGELRPVSAGGASGGLHATGCEARGRR